MASSLIVATLALLPFAAAAPVQGGVHSESLEARQAPNCNIGTGINNAAYDSSCWNTLNIMPYLTNWKTTTPTCTDADNSAGNTEGCCIASEPWSTCFLRLATRKVNVYDCTQIATASCSFPASLDPALDPTIASQVNYIVLSIMMINNFFNSYYNALQNATAVEAKTLNSVLSNDNSNLWKIKVNSQNIIAASTLGLAFPMFTTPDITLQSNDGTTVTFSSVSKRDPQDSNTGTSTGSAPQSSPTIITGGCSVSWLASYYQRGRHHRRQQQPDNCPNDTAEANPNAVGVGKLGPDSPPVVIFNQALKQSPNVATTMWPSPPNSATETVTNLATSALQDKSVTAPIVNALQLIMSDVGTFIAFAGDGIFSTPFSQGDEPLGYSSGFTGALDTYILSEMLAGNSKSATPGQIVATNPCSNGNSLCDNYYWSPVTHRQYTFSDSSMSGLISNVYGRLDVDLPTLFDGAYNCTFAGQAGGSVVSLQADNSLNVACLSVLPLYIQGDCPEGAAQVDGKCPFGSK